MITVLVAGCGFLGLAIARRVHAAGRGWSVQGLTHSAETAAGLSGEPFPVQPCDITSPEQLARLGTFDVVIHCASSGRGDTEDYRRVYFEGARQLLAVLKPAHLIFTSSTSVYPQRDGEVVTEESAAEPSRETGQILRETEELVLAHDGAVMRLSALYGPGRSVLLRKFFSGEAIIEGEGGRWINQVHRDDAAAACERIIERGAGGVFNVTDDTPLSQLAVYEHLSRRFALPLPPRGEANPHRKRGLTSKRVSNAKMRALGWQPKYPSFFDAVEHEPALAQLAREQATAPSS